MSVPPPRASGHRDALRLARAGLSALRKGATETTLGLRFPHRSAEPGNAREEFLADFYDGTGSVALVLLGARSLRSRRDAAIVDRVTEELVAAATPGRGRNSLHFGNAGLSLYLLRVAAARRSAQWRDLGLTYAEGLAPEWDHSDLLYGAAGTGLAFVAAYRATREDRWLARIDEAVAWLRVQSREDRGGLTWPLVIAPAPSDREGARCFTGLAHGAAGIAWFLDAVAAAAPAEHAVRREAARLRDAAWDWMRAMRREEGDRLWWPKADTDPTPRHHWCHGTTGIALAHFHHAACTRGLVARGDAMRDALRAAEHAWCASRAPQRKGREREPVAQCHGTAGLLDLLMTAYQASGDARWRARADDLVAVLGRTGARNEGALPWGDGAGWATGTAGVVAALLARAGKAIAPLHDVRCVPDLRRLRAPRAPSRQAEPRTAARLPVRGIRELVPALAAPIAGADTLLFLPRATRRPSAALARRILADARSEPARVALQRLDTGLARLARVHRDLLAPRALHRPDRLVRDLVGIGWYGSAAPAVLRHRVAMARALADRALVAFSVALRRAARDRHRILRGVVSGRLVEADLLEGDPHCGGQRPVRLRFARGPALVYKPRDVHMEWCVAGDVPGDVPSPATHVAAWMRALRADVRLPSHGVWPAARTHGYVEWVEPCAMPLRIAKGKGERLRFADPRLGAPDEPHGLLLRNAREAGAVWRSTGALAGQLLLFGVSDQHVENLVAARATGEPAAAWHAIDCEVALVRGAGLALTQLVPPASEGTTLARDPHTHFGFDARPANACSLGAEDWATIAHAPAGRTRVPFVPRPGDVADRWHSHLVQAPDGTFGMSLRELPAILRGLVTHWLAVRAHARELGRLVDATLAGCAVRILENTTAVYATALRRRVLGEMLHPGSADRAALRVARPLLRSELQQLRALDVPRYERRVGAREITWSLGVSGRPRAAEADARRARPLSWRASLSRYQRPRTLALAVHELTWFAAPPGPFDRWDPRHEVRLRRRARDGPIDVVILLPDGPAQFLLMEQGHVRFMGLPDR